MTSKTSLFLLNKINYFYLQKKFYEDLLPKKVYEATKEKEDVISNWSHLIFVNTFLVFIYVILL